MVCIPAIISAPDEPLDTIGHFLAAAARDPDHLAVGVEEARITYAGLERRARQMARAIVDKMPEHATKGARVLIALPQGADAYAAMIGAGLAGAVYAPVNVRAPEVRRQAICARFDPDIVVAPASAHAALRAWAPRARCIDPDAAFARAPLQGRRPRHRIAYVIHTSGSTGVPKGVEIPAEALDNYVGWIGRGIGPTPDDRISQYANIAFDLSVLEIYGALCFGASLHPPGGLGDRLMPGRMVLREDISIWISVPSVVPLMHAAGTLDARHLRSVRRFVFCGEPLQTSQVRMLFDARPDAIVQNTYGPTEATVSMTSITLARADLDGLTRHSIPLGDPIAGMGLHLCGGPSDDEGEIVLTGPQLAAGYAHDAEATARAFRVLDLASGAVRAYHTGDWGRRIEGRIYFDARIDHQVKHKGFRIELDEILGAIGACGHADACVFAHGGHLVALIEGAGDAMALRGSLATRLDAHALPDILRFVPRLPRNDNDKIDRQAALRGFAAAMEAGDGLADRPVDQGREIAQAGDRVDVAIG